MDRDRLWHEFFGLRWFGINIKLFTVKVENDPLVGGKSVAVELGGLKIFGRELITPFIKQARTGIEVFPRSDGRLRTRRRLG